MHADILNIASTPESRKYLRVATITNEQSDLFFLYIGSNEMAIKLLHASGSSGLIAENLKEAKQLVENENFSEKQIDVLLFDVPYETKEFKNFINFVRGCGKISVDTPVIYNEQQLLNVASIPDNLIDDIINLPTWQFDLAGKIDFLRKSKNYTEPVRKTQQIKIKAKICSFKRAFDIATSLVLIVLALPAMILIALAIKLESKGPIIYNARRAGKGFKIFKFFKFRSMIINADKKIDALAHLNQYAEAGNGAKFFKVANDPRITKVGRFLRNTSLDELPQLFNVLKGDMSLVGNRPLPLYEAATLTTNDFVERFMAPAGITGLWQIKKRGQSNMSVEERINLDIAYARKSTLLYDLWIMANTPAALIQKSDV